MAVDAIASRAAGAYADALRRAAGSAAGGETPQAAQDGGFGAVLGNVLAGAVETGQQAEKVGLAAAAGTANVTQVVTALNNAEVTLQAVVAVRDRVVQAYQDILRMPI